MHTFSTFLTILSIASSGVLALPSSNPNPNPNPDLEPPHPQPAPGTQPGCGPSGCHNPTGTFGLHRSDHHYHFLCDQHSQTAKRNHKVKACFDTRIALEHYLSAPNPSKLSGYIDGSGTDFLLYAGQIVTLAEKLEIHVDEAKGEKAREHGCARVRIYELPKWTLEVDETWCAGHNEPIRL